MYSPKVPERFIAPLYRLGRARGRAMTQLVAEAIERYLINEGALVPEPPTEPHRSAAARLGRTRVAA